MQQIWHQRIPCIKEYCCRFPYKGKLSIVLGILKFIPNNVYSIIDIGCGNGIITNELAKHYSVLGVDNSEEALNYLKCERIKSSSSNIPVKDQSFDMVFSSELLEHLSYDILLKTISEFTRIAKKYIIITVPNQELLEKNFIKCPKCGYIFHSYGHLNSFSKDDIIKLLGNDFKCLETNYFGSLNKDFNKFLLRIKQHIGNRWFLADKTTICPNCGNRKFQNKKGNLISRLCNGLNLIISKKRYYWFIALFERIK